MQANLLFRFYNEGPQGFPKINSNFTEKKVRKKLAFVICVINSTLTI
jgi:hypothetical protein